MKGEFMAIELRMIIHEVLEEHTDIRYIPDLAPYILEKLKNDGFHLVGNNMIVLNISENNEALDEKTIEFFVKHNAEVRRGTEKDILEKAYKIASFLLQLFLYSLCHNPQLVEPIIL